MLVRELIDKLENLPPDMVVIIGDPDIGWTNIGEVTINISTVSIIEGYTLPFSSE